jgi:hypothetical protein
MSKLNISFETRTASYGWLAAGCGIEGVVVDSLSDTSAVYSGLSDWTAVITQLTQLNSAITTEVVE